MQERELTTLEGSVEDIVFASDETGFTVLELKGAFPPPPMPSINI